MIMCEIYNNVIISEAMLNRSSGEIVWAWPLTIPLQIHHIIYVKIDDAKETMYTDQTGAFPVTSKKGNE